jgi:glycosyltransferase involved in cell wall biosynthesis
VISQTPVEERMRGVAIRSFELARQLAGVADVVLAAPHGERAPALPDVELLAYDRELPRDLRAAIARADVILAQPQPPIVTRWMNRSGARLIFDLYDPEVFENLATFAYGGSRLNPLWLSLTLDRLTSALHIGHHFLCASETQRDLWIGAMLAERAITIERYEADPSFRSVMAVVPFGLQGSPPRADPAHGIRARFPVIGPGDEIVLWNGGIWEWLDPLLPIAAVAELAPRRPGLRLVFMGGAAGAPDSPASAARAAAAERGLVGETVLFNSDWVPYEDRGAWLMEATCAVAAHGDHLETRFAFRTRLLDCFWAGLPIVATRGDDLAGRVERDDLGRVCDPGDAAGLTTALEAVLTRGRSDFAPQLARVADDYRWARVCEPLVSFVLAESAAPRLGGFRRGVAARPSQQARSLVHQVARTAVALRARRRSAP